MADCEAHLVADGQVDRSAKENGVVHRVRKCAECGTLFRTIEMTDDKISTEDVRRAEVMEKWRRERDIYQDFYENVKSIKQAVESVLGSMDDVENWEKEDGE